MEDVEVNGALCDAAHSTGAVQTALFSDVKSCQNGAGLR